MPGDLNIIPSSIADEVVLVKATQKVADCLACLAGYVEIVQRFRVVAYMGHL